MKRKYLTPKERRDMFAAQNHQCAACGDNMFIEGCIAEHWHPVALGNDQKPDCLLCIHCADRKTNGTKATSYGSDKHGIAKVKRILRKAAGTWRPHRKKIQSKGFDKSLRRKFDGTVEARNG